MLTRTLVVLTLAQCLAAQTAPAKPFVPFDVTGRVVTWDGQPIAGARIAIGDAESPTTSDLLRSDGPSTGADGSFKLACPAPAKGQQERNLLVAGKGFAARRVSLPGPGTPVALGKPFALGDLVLVPGQRMVGRVRDAAGQPVAGALVTASDLLPLLLQGGSGENYVCTTRTSASGIFDLPCALPAGSMVEVTADGWFTVRRQPVAAGSPLEFDLQPSGWIEGRVTTDGEQGLADAWLVVLYEAEQTQQSLRTDATGAFRAPLRHPGRWRLRGGPDGEQVGRIGWSKVGEGAATGVVVAVAAQDPATAPKKLAVRANTKGSGAAVRTFRAVAAWGQPVNNGKPWLRQMLSNQVHTAKPSPDGTVEVDGPPDEGVAGAVYVVAEGHAPLLQMDVAWSEKSPTLTVELEPEASVRGVVRDQATGKPIAGAAVTLQLQGEPGWGYAPWMQGADGDVPRTAADGTFRVGRLGEGDWQLLVAVEGRPPAPPQTVTLKNAQALEGLVVDVPVGARVGGKLTGGAFVPGSRVSLQPVPVGTSQMMFAQQVWFADATSSVPAEGPASGKPLAADGSFAFDGLALGHYTLMLHLPAPPRSGGVLMLPIDSFRVRAGGVQRDFDSSGDATHTIRGRLTQPGATAPFENLVVAAEPVFDGGGWMHSGYELAQGLRTFVQRDGTFALPAIAGSYRMAVVDLLLGLTVAVSKTIEVREADVVCDLEVPLTKVTVELKPASGAAMAFVDRIEVRSLLAAQRETGATLDLDDSYDFGRGILVPRGATSLTLTLPHGDVCLLARSNAARLRAEEEGQQSPSLGKLEVQVPGDKKPSVVLEIGPPPEISDEVPAAGGKGR